MDDSDVAGPILFFLLFGTFLLFAGKVHFGFIYGLALMGSTTLHYILSLMSPDDYPGASSAPHPPPYSSAPSYPEPAGAVGSSDATKGHGPGGGGGHLSSTLTFARSASVLGYCLLPL